MRDWCINIKHIKLVIKKISLSTVSLTLENEASSLYIVLLHLFIFFLLDSLRYGTLFSATKVFDYHFYLFLLQYVFYRCQIWILFVLRIIYLHFLDLYFWLMIQEKIFTMHQPTKLAKFIETEWFQYFVVFVQSKC